MVKYSKLKIVANLQSRGLWSHAKDWMQTNGDIYDLFMAAQFLTSDHPKFAEILAALQAELGVSGDTVNEILEASIDAE